MKRHLRRLAGERGTAILETALTLPLLLLVSVGIFEFGRAYQTWQVLTNAAREGARLAVMPGQPSDAVEARVRQYLKNGQLPNEPSATVAVDPNAKVDIGGGATAKASLVTVTYPFQFVVLQPVARLVVSGSKIGAPLNLVSTAEMRNESQ
jgi:Flp pilus assembly protein TadG